MNLDTQEVSDSNIDQCHCHYLVRTQTHRKWGFLIYFKGSHSFNIIPVKVTNHHGLVEEIWVKPWWCAQSSLRLDSTVSQEDMGFLVCDHIRDRSHTTVLGVRGSSPGFHLHRPRVKHSSNSLTISLNFLICKEHHSIHDGKLPWRHRSSQTSVKENAQARVSNIFLVLLWYSMAHNKPATKAVSLPTLKNRHLTTETLGIYPTAFLVVGMFLLSTKIIHSWRQWFSTFVMLWPF